jgi:hypothetical protein
MPEEIESQELIHTISIRILFKTLYTCTINETVPKNADRAERKWSIGLALLLLARTSAPSPPAQLRIHNVFWPYVSPSSVCLRNFHPPCRA